jgi:hypothetical protein
LSISAEENFCSLRASRSTKIDSTYGLWEGSGGAGRHRGGNGVIRALRVLDHDARVSLQSDRRKFSPYGLHGGADGKSGGVLQLPSSVEDYRNPEMAADINRYIRSPGYTSEQRSALLKMTWDMVGSEFAGRHQQYEKFYAGAPFIVRTHMYRHYDFKNAVRLVEQALSPESMVGYDEGRLI